jgi:pimeloyl-ACP methyl ester carboxylesterase
MPFAAVRGDNLYYEVHGSGETVVLLHHGFSAVKMWERIFPGMVRAGYRVVMFDRRGYGKSEPGPDFEQFYLSDAFCDENVESMAGLMGLLGVDSFHLVGQCEGGVIGIEYAVKYPEQVRSMVVAGTQCYGTMPMPDFNAWKFPLPFHELDPAIRQKIVHWHGEGHAEFFYNLTRVEGGAYGRGVFDIRPLLPSVRCPTLVLYPDRSGLFEVEQAVAFYRGIPRAELAVFPKCGHNTYDNQPEQYLQAVLTFLERASRAETVDEPDFSMTCIAPAPPVKSSL